ncbi:MAG: hypothetical protein CMJ32_07220, partial [Phycisphaerae bacterium]|nr:hypothetical protein [Phycisphaerae bacterium]
MVAIIAIVMAGGLVLAYVLSDPVPAITYSKLTYSDPEVRPVRSRGGVPVKLTAGDTVVTRSLPAVGFDLEEGESLHRDIPPGPFEIMMNVDLEQPRDLAGRMGASFTNGQFSIERNGNVIVEGVAGEEPARVMTESLFLPAGNQKLVMRYRHDGNGVARLRGLWRPRSANGDLDIPIPIGSFGVDSVTRGGWYVAGLNCIRCHEADLESDHWLAGAGGPVLTGVGSRVGSQWLRTWLKDPSSLKPETSMPSLFHGEIDDEAIEDLVHFLCSTGDTVEPLLQQEQVDQTLVETGKILYHKVGCFACHGPLERRGALAGFGSLTEDPEPGPGPISLGPLGAKTTIGELAAFLQDPHQTRPHGRMPSLQLSPIEARSIAAYLVRRTGTGDIDAPSSVLVPEPDRIARGRMEFSARGCANCHELDVNGVRIDSVMNVPTWDHVVDEGISRSDDPSSLPCLGQSPPEAPLYAMTSTERDDIMEFAEAWNDGFACSNVPADELARHMVVNNCLACHEYHQIGGPDDFTTGYFQAAVESDAGDEGRLPPNLDHVGSRLRQDALDRVLLEEMRARPYMATRMPSYGEAVSDLSDLLRKSAGVPVDPGEEPEFSESLAAQGRHLVGVGGFNCIQCHGIAGKQSTVSAGPDLGDMVERLRFDAFHRWVLDPRAIRSGTRMPTFFNEGRSGATDILGGDADKQIAAIWSYLSQGEFLALPDGLEDAGSQMIVIEDAPIVFRTYMKGAGVRAIACGYPEQVHLAFDPMRCRPMLAWSGSFLDAGGAWANRGGQLTDPEEVQWEADRSPLFPGITSRTDPDGVNGTRFRGYRLD